MRRFRMSALAVAVALAATPAAADPDKDESGKNRRYGGYYCDAYGCRPLPRKPKYKYEYKRDGSKLEWKSGGCEYKYERDRKGYKEEYKCDD